jgi:hypothetical protein
MQLVTHCMCWLDSLQQLTEADVTRAATCNCCCPARSMASRSSLLAWDQLPCVLTAEVRLLCLHNKVGLKANAANCSNIRAPQNF